MLQNIFLAVIVGMLGSSVHYNQLNVRIVFGRTSRASLHFRGFVAPRLDESCGFHSQITIIPKLQITLINECAITAIIEWQITLINGWAITAIIEWRITLINGWMNWRAVIAWKATSMVLAGGRSRRRRPPER